jgi:outer membrane protein assembly factor BamB
MADTSFPPETIDEQTGQPHGTLPPEDARLIADLHRIYHPLAASNARSLGRVQARLEQREARLDRSSSKPPRPAGLAHPSPAKERSMKPAVPGLPSGGAWRRGISALAAILLLAVLVGSISAVFALARHGKGTANPNQQHSTPAVSAATITPEPPPPPPAPGIYIISARTFYAEQVSKLDPQTKQPLWTQPVGAMGPALSSGGDPYAAISTPSIVVYGDTLYVTSGDADPALYNNYVYAIDANSGAVRWKVNVSSDVFTSPQYGGPYDLGVLGTPTVADGVVYVGARDGKLYALDAATGARRWTFDAPASTFINGFLSDANQPFVAQGVVYEAIHNLLYALDARTGRQLWSRQIVATQLFNGLALVAGVLYLSSREESAGAWPRPQHSAVYAYTARDGQPLWQHAVNSWLITAPTVANGLVYVGAYDYNLYALSARDGSQRWRYTTSGEIFDQPLAANGIIYTDELGAQDGPSSDTSMLYAINGTDGRLVWKQFVNKMLSLQQVQDGVIYVGVWPGQLAALSVQDGSVLWQQHYGAKLIDKTGTQSEMPPVVTVIG